MRATDIPNQSHRLTHVELTGLNPDRVVNNAAMNASANAKAPGRAQLPTTNRVEQLVTVNHLVMLEERRH